VSNRLEGITRLLAAAGDDPGAEDELLGLVYGELKVLAHARLVRFGAGQEIQTTELVHEVWLRLLRRADPGWQGRRHFFGVAARAMRDILVEQYRRKGARKRDGLVEKDATGSIPELTSGVPIEDVLSLGEALERFQVEHPRPAEVVWLRFFNGFTMPETAEVMGLSLATAEREWRFARAWLLQVLEHDLA
jgi:RNA polymerase sigma factor (TIGR02999 family)